MATTRPLTYRDLLVMARERLGAGAAALKTREELQRALGLEVAPVPESLEGDLALVTSDFFITREKSAAKK